MPECAGVPGMRHQGSGLDPWCSGKRLQEGEPTRQQGVNPILPAGLCCSEVGAALQQGSDSVLQGHSYFLGGLA